MRRNAPTAQLTVPVEPRDHTLGPRTAPVTLVEYGDYECPHCGAAHPIVKALLQSLGRRLSYVYRHFPIATAHPHAPLAAEAAGAQGMFWEMHDMLFENQDALSDPDLLDYAATLDLDLARFTRELAGHTYAPRVRADFISGVRSGVRADFWPRPRRLDSGPFGVEYSLLRPFGVKKPEELRRVTTTLAAKLLASLPDALGKKLDGVANEVELRWKNEILFLARLKAAQTRAGVPRDVSARTGTQTKSD